MEKAAAPLAFRREGRLAGWCCCTTRWQPWWALTHTHTHTPLPQRVLLLLSTPRTRQVAACSPSACWDLRLGRPTEREAESQGDGQRMCFVASAASASCRVCHLF